MYLFFFMFTAGVICFTSGRYRDNPAYALMSTRFTLRYKCRDAADWSACVSASVADMPRGEQSVCLCACTKPLFQRSDGCWVRGSAQRRISSTVRVGFCGLLGPRTARSGLSTREAEQGSPAGVLVLFVPYQRTPDSRYASQDGCRSLEGRQALTWAGASGSPIRAMPLGQNVVRKARIHGKAT